MYCSVFVTIYTSSECDNIVFFIELNGSHSHTQNFCSLQYEILIGLECESELLKGILL